jgi:hypothetical protein
MHRLQQHRQRSYALFDFIGGVAAPGRECRLTDIHGRIVERILV